MVVNSYKAFCLLCIVGLTVSSCEDQNLLSTVGALNSTYQANATGSATTYNQPTPSETRTPAQLSTPATQNALETATVAPTSTPSIQEVTPCGAYICETTDNQQDEDILARLCVVEVRGFAEVRDDACASVVSTVMNRMFNLYLSDGTVRGTILWNCTETSCMQFPGYVVNGCDGIQPVACPWSYPDDIAHFRDVVDHFLRGRWGPGFWCSGYFYYDSRPQSVIGDMCAVDGLVPCYTSDTMHQALACMIQSSNGQREIFHN